MSKVISTVTKVLNSVNDPLGIFTGNNYQKVNVGGSHGVFGKTGEKIFTGITNPMQNYKDDIAPDIEIPSTLQMSPVEDTTVTKAATVEASNIRRRKASANMIKTSGSGVTDSPTVGLKKILG
jgi:hypothetical protein